MRVYLQKIHESAITVSPFFSDEDLLEDLVEKHISKDAALDLKRRRYVVGTCSYDTSPIKHATQIARLAGETCCMEIFLRSHLNVLYDRFQRASDGNYAERGRQTYAGDLEALGIDFNLLLPGTLLASRNHANNHYYGSLGRASRAIADLKSKDAVYQTLIAMVADKKLDYHNRVNLYFVALNYNYYLSEQNPGTSVRRNLNALKRIAVKFPEQLSTALMKRVEDLEQSLVSRL